MIGYLESLPQRPVYNADGTLNYIEITDGTATWRQIYTYVNGVLSGVSSWTET